MSDPKEAVVVPVGPTEADWTQAEIDDDYFDDEPTDEDIAGEECGRWRNGRLTAQCSKAGSEECDWECPYSR